MIRVLYTAKHYNELRCTMHNPWCDVTPTYTPHMYLKY